MKQKIIISILLLLLAIPASSAVATINIGAISYDSTVVKDESITVSSSVTASTVTGTLTVDVTLTDNSGLFNIPTPVQQLQFTTNSTKAISWTIKATSSGTSAAPFTITGSGDDGSNGVRTSSSAVTVKDRPIISISASSNVSSITSGGTASVSYIVSNDASVGAADATNVEVTLVNPAGWSLLSGTNPYALGSIAPGASKSGSWILRADSPAASNTLTLNAISSIPGGTISSSLSISGPSGNGGDGSSGGGSGGGGGASVENPSNIVVIEKYDLIIYKNRLTSYRYTNNNNPVMFVNVTGNVSTSEITSSIEVLKNTSSMLKVAAPDIVYKNLNIWVGSISFATPKNINAGVIRFMVENAWIESNKIQSVRMVRWDGSNWIGLETTQVSKDNTFTYYDSSTQSFSYFAITGVSSSGTSATIRTLEPTSEKVQETTSTTGKKKTAGFEIILAAASISALYLWVLKRR